MEGLAHLRIKKIFYYWNGIFLKSKLPLSQYDTGEGEASTWHSNCTSDPNGAPKSWDGALTVGETEWTEEDR